MKNFIQNGDMISAIAPVGGIASGQGIVVGSLFGVAAKAAAEGEGVEIATVGVYELPKAPATAIAQGARVAWDDTAKQVALPGTGLYPVGIATEAAGNGATTVRVRLDGVATAAA
jgi:predicted RecA/RadA family phage recombinase